MGSFVSQLAREQPVEQDCNIWKYFWIDWRQIKFSCASEHTHKSENKRKKEYEISRKKFDNSLQFVHGLWTSGWITFVFALGKIIKFYTSIYMVIFSWSCLSTCNISVLFFVSFFILLVFHAISAAVLSCCRFSLFQHLLQVLFAYLGTLFSKQWF